MYKGAEVDHNLNMKLQFNTAGKKKKKGADDLQCLYVKHGR